MGAGVGWPVFVHGFSAFAQPGFIAGKSRANGG